MIIILAIAWFANLICWRFDHEIYLKFKNKYLDYYILNCSTCLGFWLGIIYTHNIFISLVISLISALIEKYLMIWNE